MTQTNFIFQTITGPILEVQKEKSATSTVLKVCSADNQGIRGYGRPRVRFPMASMDFFKLT
jgi:hypothetical protein